MVFPLETEWVRPIGTNVALVEPAAGVRCTTGRE